MKALVYALAMLAATALSAIWFHIWLNYSPPATPAPALPYPDLPVDNMMEENRQTAIDQRNAMSFLCPHSSPFEMSYGQHPADGPERMWLWGDK